MRRIGRKSSIAFITGAKIAAIALVVALFLCDAILLGGGHGPFALYRKYWICHCSDLPADSGSRTAARDLLHPSIKKSRLSGSPVFRSGNEICHAKQNNGFHVCKRKLPLRYLSILMGGAAFTILDNGFRNPAPLVDTSHIVRDVSFVIPDGLKSDLNRPPRI